MDINLTRDFSPTFINKVLNDPAVRGGAKIEHTTDLTNLVKDIRNIVLKYEKGCFLLVWISDGVYDVHTLALKDGRGKMLRQAIEKAMEYMFFETECELLTTLAYKNNAPSVALSDSYFNRMSESEELITYNLTYHDWIIKSETARLEGERFHSQVDANHDDDKAHDCYVGGSILILKSGNVYKSTKLYNEWAETSGYEEISILNNSPLLLKIGDMMLNSDLEQISCQ